MQPTDIELMLRVRGGDVAAFRELVERYRGPLWRFFAAVLEDRSRADVSCEVGHRQLVRALESADGQGPLHGSQPDAGSWR